MEWCSIIFQTKNSFAKGILETLTLEQSNKTLENISLANLFYHADSEADVGVYAREAIRRLLNPIPYESIATTEYKTYLVQGLSHFSPDVRKLSLQQVEKCLANERASSLMVNQSKLCVLLGHFHITSIC